MKLLSIVFLCATLTGCGNFSKGIASVTGFDKTCVDGVQYIQFTSGDSVAYDTTGKVKVCQ
jgi:hypothetical protein